MSEKELNEKYIRKNIEGICQDCMYLDMIVPIIDKMLSKQYCDGLRQAKFDNEMELINLKQINIELNEKIDKAIEVFENEIKNLKEQKRLIMNILTPENGYLKADIDYEIKRLERYLEILRSKE